MIPVDRGLVRGSVAPGFEPVADAFCANFSVRGDHGCACAIHWQGEVVVDLWGGWKDQAGTARWNEDTLLLVYSLTKGMTGLAAAVAVSQGLFSYDQRVVEVWPEFGAHGKAAVTIGELLSEQAGIAAIDLKLSLSNMGDQPAIAAAIASQRPNWTPGDWAGNHSYTLGWLACELIQRCDPAGRTLGQFFAEEIAGPLGAEFYIGLPKQVARDRLARINGFSFIDMFTKHTDMPWSMVFALIWPWSLSFRALNNPFLLRGPSQIDSEPYREIELGAIGGIGSARAMAAIYNEFATGGKKLGLRHELLETLAAGFAKPAHGMRDKVIGMEVYYSFGLEKPSADWNFAPSPSAFGTFAVGGSFAFADPDDQIAYAWVTNKLGLYKRNDPREQAVRDAFYSCLQAR